MIEKDIAGIRLVGTSLAGEESVLAAPEYNVCFDVGRAPREIIPIDTVCVTHGHMDHAAGIAYYLGLAFVTGPVLLIALQLLNAWAFAGIAGIGLPLFQQMIPRPGLSTGLFINTRRVGASVSRFIERIEKCDLAIVVGTPLYRKKYDNKDTSTGYVVAAEVDLISNRLMGTETKKETVLPLLRAGEKAGEQGQMLDRAARFYHKDVMRTTAKLSSVLQPLLFVVVGALICVQLAAVYLPMFTVFDLIG